jgi:hypothetical protein
MMEDIEYWWQIVPSEGKYYMAKKWSERRVLAKSFCYLLFNKDDII